MKLAENNRSDSFLRETVAIIAMAVLIVASIVVFGRNSQKEISSFAIEMGKSTDASGYKLKVKGSNQVLDRYIATIVEGCTDCMSSSSVNLRSSNSHGIPVYLVVPNGVDIKPYQKITDIPILVANDPKIMSNMSVKITPRQYLIQNGVVHRAESGRSEEDREYFD
jgi:hypothetical protein